MKHYRFRGEIYGEKAHYYDFDKDNNYPYFETIPNTEIVEIIEAENLTAAEDYFRHKYPERFQGCGISCIDDGECEFSCLAIPGISYNRGEYETIENRIKWALSR